jgi:branched-chain amino acid transport system ATP-binding protein
MGGYLLKPRDVGARVEHVVEVFPQLGRMLKRRAGKLSGGERKMLAMGRALMLEPPLVVLDEPTANLAPMIAMSVLHDHVRQLATTGASVLIVEQRAKAVLEISDRTYVLGGGQLRMQGSPAELSNNPEFVQSFLGGHAPPQPARS